MRCVALLGGFTWVSLATSSLATAEPRGEILEEITVTAQKRVEPARDIGMSIEALGQSDIAAHHLTRIDQIADLEPNVSLNKSYGNANPVIVIRGVGLQDFNTNNTPTVGMYLDEVYLPSNAMADVAIFDVERIEIMKGPQGTLWGRNATGGAVNIVPKRPTDALEALFQVSAGSDATSGALGAIGGQLADGLNGRLAATWNQRDDGIFRSRTTNETAGEFESWALRGALQWTPTEHNRYLLSVNAGDHRGTSYPFSHVGITGTQCPIALASPGRGQRDDTHCTNTTTGYSDPDGTPAVGDWDVFPLTSISQTVAALRAEFDLEHSQIVSITALTRAGFVRGEDNDTSALPLLQISYDSDIEAVSQEVRWGSTTDAPLEWLTGFSISRHTHDEQRSANLTGLFGPMLQAVDLAYGQRVTSMALFADGAAPLGSQFTMRAGLRYTHEALSFNGGSRPRAGSHDPAFVAMVFPGLPALADFERTYDDLSGRVTLEWKPANSTLLFAGISKAFKSGGVFGGFGLSPEAFVPYNPEHLYSLEVGAKWRRDDRRLQFDMSAFYYDYEDLQGQLLVTGATGSIPQLTNVGDVRIFGADLTLRWLPIDGLTTSLGLGALDSELRNDITALDSLQRPIELQGNELPHAPDLSANAAASYAWSLQNGYSLSLSGDLSYRSTYYNDLPNQMHLRQTEPVLLSGARIALTNADTWTVEAWGRNLSNERTVTHGNSSGIGNDLLMYSEPRAYGVQLEYRWR